eukprot:gene9015-9188_t
MLQRLELTYKAYDVAAAVWGQLLSATSQVPPGKMQLTQRCCDPGRYGMLLKGADAPDGAAAEPTTTQGFAQQHKKKKR